MGKIGQGYGSKWHFLRYMGRHRNLLDAQVLRLLRADSISWLDFPFRMRGKGHDDEWTGVDFVGQKSVQAAWQHFWRRLGMCRTGDAVARVRSRAGSDWLLVEAKSHLGEIQTSCGAKARGGRGQIAKAMDEVKQALGVPSEADWLKGTTSSAIALRHSISSERLAFLLSSFSSTSPGIPSRAAVSIAPQPKLSGCARSMRRIGTWPCLRSTHCLIGFTGCSCRLEESHSVGRAAT